jgi:hypothetical protein
MTDTEPVTTTRQAATAGVSAVPTVGALPADLLTAELTAQPAVVGYLRELARVRDLPISVPLAFNALAYAYDLHAGRYDPSLLEAHRLPTVSLESTIDALPVGALAQLATGGAPQPCEVVFRHAEHKQLGGDGTCPPWLSGAPVGATAPGQDSVAGEIIVRERLVIDATALGATAGQRLRRLTGRAITDERHVLVHAGYVDAAQADLDDTRLYASYLLRRRRDDLRRVLAPLRPVEDDTTLAETLHATLDVLTALLDAAGLLRWREHYLHPATYDRWLAGDGIAREIEPADVDQFCRTVAMTCLPVQRRHMIRAARPAYFALGPTLREQVRDDADPTRTAAGLRGPRYATALTCAQLYLATQLAEVHGGIVEVGGAEVHVRLDDGWQGGGVWRAHVAARNEILDPVELPLALGWLTALEPSTTYQPRQRSRRTSTSLPPASPAPPEEPTVEPTVERTGEQETAAAAANPDSTATPAEPEPPLHDDPDSPDAPQAADSWVDDTTLGWKFVLGPRYASGGVVPLTPKVAARMREAFEPRSVLHLDLNHQGAQLPAEQRRQQVTFDGRRLHGLTWPDELFLGIRLTASWSSDSYQIAVASTALDEPVDVDGIPLDYDFSPEMVLRFLLGPVDLDADTDALAAPVLRALLCRHGRLVTRTASALFTPLRELVVAVRAHATAARQPEPTTAQVSQAIDAAISGTGAVRMCWGVLLTRDDGDGPWLTPRWPCARDTDWYAEPTQPRLSAGDPAVVLSLHPTPADRPSRKPAPLSGVGLTAEEFLRRGHLRRLPRGRTPRQRHLAIEYAKAMGWDPRTLDPRITYVSESYVRQ